MVNLVPKITLAICFVFSLVAATRPVDEIIKPVWIAPSQSQIDAGDSVSLTFHMDGYATSPTAIMLSSSHPDILSVPTSATVSTGRNYATALGVSSPSRLGRASTVVTITASANGGAKTCQITVN